MARVNANAAVAAKPRRPKGMTIRQAVAVMKNNRSVRKVFARNEETKKAARILMGAYFSSGERGCPSLQQIVDRFSVTVAAPPKTAKEGDYNINANGVGYFVTHRKVDRIVRYIARDGLERTSCTRNNLDGSGGYFKTKTEAETAIAAHKNKPFNVGDTVQAVANPTNGLSNTGYFTIGEKFVISGVATSQNTVKLVGRDGYWDKSRFELVESTPDNKWAKIVERIAARSHTIERATLTANSATLVKDVVADDISECLNKGGFPEISSGHVYLPKPITEIGYYKVLLSFPGGSQGWINVWVVPV
jgi:hypothetical protein